MYSMQHVFPCLFFVYFVLFFPAHPHCFWLADLTRNIEKKTVWPKTYCVDTSTCEKIHSSTINNARVLNIAQARNNARGFGCLLTFPPERYYGLLRYISRCGTCI